MDLIIEKAVLPPGHTNAKGKLVKYPFHLLNAGERMVIRIEKDPRVERHRIRCACYQYQKAKGLDWLVSTRIEGKNICLYRIK